MPTINPSLVPSINPGSLFSRFTSDPTINIRWYVPVDPVSDTVLNRPLGDIALRQLILAKTVDTLNIRLGHQSLFPFLIQPQLNNGSSNVDVPLSWIWDMHASLPSSWERLRLAKVVRLSGTNIDTNNDEYTGMLRLIFTANKVGSTQEVAILKADYHIDSNLTYQLVQFKVPSVNDDVVVFPNSESETVGGFITFKTLDVTDNGVQAFLNVVGPPLDPTNVDSNGFYLNPTVVELNDSLAGGSGITNDFDFVAVSHGSGLLTISAYNSVPATDSTIPTWVSTFNYPFESTATLQSSTNNVIIPVGLFKEFNLTAPGSDRPTGDISGEHNPVWINRIVRLDPTADKLEFIFATLNVESPSQVPVEFASLVLSRSFEPGARVAITPLDNLFKTRDGEEWMQGFGNGHVSLSDLWGDTSSTIDDFFDRFITIIDEPPQAIFTEEATLISSFGLSRVPKTVPTLGQYQALFGSRDKVASPNQNNRYVVEADQGLGDKVDFSASELLPVDKRDNPDIERYGYTGSLTHRCVKMVIDESSDNLDYNEDILPRLRILFGRDPIFGDFWWDGTTLKFFNGDTWVA